MSVVFVIVWLIFFLPALGVVMLIGWLTRYLSRRARMLLLIVASCLLLTPTWGPATVAEVPTTFGWLLIPTILIWGWSDLAGYMLQYPRWNAVAFPVTALLSYLIVRWKFSGNSFNSTLTRNASN